MNMNDRMEIPEEQHDSIHLYDLNMGDYGFVRFYYPEEKEKIIQQGYRVINFGKNTQGATDFLKIIIPEKYLISLSINKEEKLIAWPDYKIETVGNRFDQLRILSKRAGWNQTEQDLEVLMSLSGTSYYLAVLTVEDHPISLGSGALINLGEAISWISMILVHEEVRRQGIAASLLYRCLLDARTDDKNMVIGLDATPEGKTLYVQMGFEKSFSVWRCMVPTDLYCQEKNEFSVERCINFEEVLNYLNRKGFGEREKLFRAMGELAGDGCFIHRRNDQIAGLVMNRSGARKAYIGPLIAEDERIAKGLLAKSLDYWKDRQIESVLIDIPSDRLLAGSGRKDDRGEDLMVPAAIKGGFLNGGEVLRTFDRMYHLVSRENQTVIFNFFSEYSPHRQGTAQLIEQSVKNYDQTRSYLEKEKNEILKYQYAIGGPEFS